MAHTFAQKVSGSEMLTHRHAWKAGEDFEVISRDGVTRYQVRVVDGRPTCSCPASGFGLTCWHLAVIARRLMREGVACS